MVVVNVSGDPTEFPAFFNAYLDDKLVGTVKPNDSLELPVNTGSHRVTINATETEWCDGSNHTQSADVLKDQVVSIGFSVSCPPLVGTGSIVVGVAAEGTAIPDSFPVSLTRINGAPFSLRVNAPATGAVELALGALQKTVVTTVPVGEYQIKVETRGCEWGYWWFATSEPFVVRAVVRTEATATVAASFYC